MGKYCYDYPRPAVSADCALFGFDGSDLFLLLICRGAEPFRGRWALPGGFMEISETAEQCAIRELKEETGIEVLYLLQLGAFSGVDRDPRGRIVSVVFTGMIKMEGVRVVAGDDAVNAKWFRLNDIPALAFDHDLIMLNAVDRLKAALKSGTGQEDWPFDGFTGSELQKVTAIVSGYSTRGTGASSK